MQKIDKITSQEILFPVDVELDTEESILSGTSINVYIPIYSKEQVLMVPRKAIISFNSETFLYTVSEDGIVKKEWLKKVRLRME